MARAMSFAMLSSVAGGGGDDVAAIFNAETGVGGDTAGGAWLTGFFFNVVFFSGIVTYGERCDVTRHGVWATDVEMKVAR